MVTISCFCEDVAQDKFVKGLIRRVAGEASAQVAFLSEGNASGGAPQLMVALEAFIARTVRASAPPDVLVIAYDADDMSELERRRQVQAWVQRTGYRGCVAYATPVPCIESWYLADTVGLQNAFHGAIAPVRPSNPRADCDAYKSALVEGLRAMGLRPLLGGAEFGERIARSMRLYDASRTDTSLRRFLDDLKQGVGATSGGGAP